MNNLLKQLALSIIALPLSLHAMEERSLMPVTQSSEHREYSDFELFPAEMHNHIGSFADLETLQSLYNTSTMVRNAYAKPLQIKKTKKMVDDIVHNRVTLKPKGVEVLQGLLNGDAIDDKQKGYLWCLARLNQSDLKLTVPVDDGNQQPVARGITNAMNMRIQKSIPSGLPNEMCVLIEQCKCDDDQLNLCASTGSVDSVKTLLFRDADTNKHDYDGFTSLHWVSYTGNTELAELLVVHGADINKVNYDDLTPLYLACREGHAKCIELLIARGARYDNSALHYACCFDHADCAELLLARGADINKQNSKGDTPLHEACRVGRKNIVKLLLAHGADINKHDRWDSTPLHTACWAGEQECIATLLDHSADGKIKDINGKTALDIALIMKRTEIVELLRSHMEN